MALERILVACEFSGIVRDAFIRAGHQATSCDLLRSEWPGPHIQEDVLLHLEDGWDMIIAHPPCTYLALSGARWWAERQAEQEQAIEFIRQIANAPVQYIAIENPIGKLNTAWRKPDQIIQPWQFGHPETKATCLWLKNLPRLQPTSVVEKRKPKVHYMAPRFDRWRRRSRTYQGIADAMAQQWGELIT